MNTGRVVVGFTNASDIYKATVWSGGDSVDVGDENHETSPRLRDYTQEWTAMTTQHNYRDYFRRNKWGEVEQRPRSNERTSGKEQSRKAALAL